MNNRTPVTVLTGYLGAGKTTLLNRILSEDHGQRYAVIVNEFGEIGIDSQLIINSDEELFEMNNGCICCTVRGDLIRTLHTLIAKHDQFDAIIIETTGLAAPSPIAQTFFIDQALQAEFSLDSITTLVDAKHITNSLTDSREAVEQIAFADQIILNKVELVSAEYLKTIEARLRKINPFAPIYQTERANTPLDSLLNKHHFDLEHIVSLEPDFFNPPHGESGHLHTSDCHHHDNHQDEQASIHDQNISSVSLISTAPMDSAKITEWITALIAEQGQDILRAKGIVHAQGEDRRLVFQAVHMMLEGDFQQPWKSDEIRSSQLVFIGRNLNREALTQAFNRCIAS